MKILKSAAEMRRVTEENKVSNFLNEHIAPLIEEHANRGDYCILCQYKNSTLADSLGYDIDEFDEKIYKYFVEKITKTLAFLGYEVVVYQYCYSNNSTQFYINWGDRRRVENDF